PRWYDDAAALIADKEVNAIYVATPPSSHKKYTIAAAEAGKPVYVEKPMALNYNECQQMIKACQHNNVPLFVAYYRRALPRFLKIKSLLDSGYLGQILAVNVRLFQKPKQKDLKGADHWRVKPEIAGGGYFYDLASHMLDLLQYYLGPIQSASGYQSNSGQLYDAEDNVVASFNFNNKVLGNGIWNFYSSREVDETEILGTKGWLKYSTFKNNPIILQTDGEKELFEIDNPAHIQQPLIQAVVDDLLGKGTSPSTGRTGALTNKVMDQIFNN
ncbi:MAG TPA: Gfo/Idh/MocA family oxidoreductase, partial [bacterium]|nr:Gfo/Idh/MocA family oxidoreductase [bacterium]